MVRMIATFPDDSDTKESEQHELKYLLKLIPHDSTNQKRGMSTYVLK